MVKDKGLDSEAGKGVQLDPKFAPAKLASSIQQAIAKDSDKELWLLQLPVDLDVSEAGTWKVHPNESNAVLAHCDVDGSSFMMIEDDAAMSLPVYIVPTSTGGRAVPVARRVTVCRRSEAPEMCFDFDVPLEDHAPQTATRPQPSKKTKVVAAEAEEAAPTKKKKKDKKRDSEAADDDGEKKRKKKNEFIYL